MPGADRDHERDRDDQRPSAGAGRATTSAARSREPPHRLPVQVGDRGRPAGRRAVGDDPAAGELDHPVGDAGDLAVVGDDEHGGARLVGLLVEQLEDLHAGAEVELAGRLVGEQDRVAGRERARDRDALLLAAGELVREVPQRARASPTRSSISAATARASPRPATSAPNSTFSSAVSAGNRLKVWKMKLTVWRRKREQLAPRCAG